MKKNLFYGFLIAVLLASLAALPGQARETQSNPATAKWFTGWADKNTSTGVGSYPSIAYNPSDNLPYISYYDSVNGNLMLTSPTTTASNCGDNNLWWCRVVDGNSTASGKTNGDVGQFSSIAFWEGGVGPFQLPEWKLGISYHDTTNNALKVAIWTQPFLGGGSWTYSTVDANTSVSGELGTHTSIKFASDGTARVAYYSHWSVLVLPPSTYVWFGSLKLARQVTSGGNCGSGNWQCDMIDSGANAGVGQYASLGLGSNNVDYIAYYDAVNANLKYANFAGVTMGNCGPGNSYDCLTIESGGNVGLFTSLTAPRSSGDRPRIAYYNKTSGNLRYAVATSSGSGGNCGGVAWRCDTIEAIGAGLIYHVGISMALDENGDPIIAYENAADDLGPSVLNIARPASAVDQLIGNCGPSGGLFFTWQCDTIDYAGNPSIINVAAYTSVAVSSSGLATIAYFETDDYTPRTNLKVAYQRLQVYAPLIRR
jgi:hypothetical protein